MVAADIIATLIGPIALALLLLVGLAVVVAVGAIGIELTAFAVFRAESRVERDHRLVLLVDRSIRMGVVIELRGACDNDSARNARKAADGRAMARCSRSRMKTRPAVRQRRVLFKRPDPTAHDKRRLFAL